MRKTIGILGGMGPAATSHFYDLIVSKTPARQDQDHCKTIIYSNPGIPDRTHAILTGDHGSIHKALGESCRILEKAGADFIVIPCNTVHYFIDFMRSQVAIPIHDMIEETGKHIKLNHPEISEVGLFGTKGTLSSGIYQQRLTKRQLGVRLPGPKTSEQIMEIIYQIKESGPGDQLKSSLLEELRAFREESGAEWVILGCTELPLLIPDESELRRHSLFDPMRILADFAILRAMGGESGLS